MKKSTILIAVVALLTSAAPVAAATYTIGNCEGSNNFGNSIMISQKLNLPATCDLYSIGLNFNGAQAAGNYVAGVYADGPTGSPLSYSVDSIPADGGWKDSTNLTATPSMGPADYWLVMQTSGANVVCWEQPGAAGYYKLYAYDGTMPSWTSDGVTAYVVNMRITCAEPIDTSMLLELNGSAVDRNYTQYTIANFVGTLNVSGTVELNSSYADFVNGSGASPLEYNLNVSTIGDDLPVTAYFYGNATHNPSNATLHFNVTEQPTPPTTTTTTTTTTLYVPPTAPPLNVSAIYCLDDDTLRVQQAVTVNSSISTRVEDTFCMYGCDSVLSMCEPAPILIIAAFAAVFIAAVVIGKRYRK